MEKESYLLLREDFILEHLFTLEPNSNCVYGLRLVYFLLRDKKVVYVGQSSRGLARIFEHQIDSLKKFDSVSYIFLGREDDLNDFEAFYIANFRPIYNILMPKNNRIITLASIARLLNISHCTLRKFLLQVKMEPLIGKLYDRLEVIQAWKKHKEGKRNG